MIKRALIDKGNNLVPLGIKSGETVANDFFKNLEFWKKLPDNYDSKTGLIYGGDRSYIRNSMPIYLWRNL
jgi:hypothetical protein